MADTLMHFPTWVYLKGEDAVPETVHHVVCMVDPLKDTTWHNMKNHVQTDAVHQKDNVRPNNQTPETFFEAVKIRSNIQNANQKHSCPSNLRLPWQSHR